MEYSFGNWIRQRRKSLDLTQQELAERVGCSTSLIFKIESEERRPSRQIADLLAQHLQIPPDQHQIFLKIARREKGIGGLESIPAHPPLGSAPPLHRQSGRLPAPATPLVGREHEVRAITRQLNELSCRMLTLTGPGGVGKTRLAIEAGHQLGSRFTDGVYFISLAGAGMTESILPAIADGIGLVFSGPAEHMMQITTHLRDRKVLIVIDNMEHLLDWGNFLGEILDQTRHAKFLVTSREPLRLQWEWLFEVQGLPIPHEAHANIGENSAVSLFVQRARQTSWEYSLEAEDAEALVRICKLTGGLPLAIELAASWVRILNCREIAQELEKGLDLLETSMIDVPSRHRSIKSVFDHSWELLSAEERNLLMRLSVFQGGFTREAAAETMGASLSMLSSLVDKSLLRHGKNPDRYDLHELIRQYAYLRLQASPEQETAASERHARYYAEWIAALEAPFKSARQRQISHLIRFETSNWLAGWHWAVRNHRLDLLRRMSPCLNWYFEVHGYYDEALSAFSAALDEYRSIGAPAVLKEAKDISAFAGLVDQVGWFEFRKGNMTRGDALLAESLETARPYDDPEILYYIYGNWGYLCLTQGEIAKAEKLTNECLACSRRLDSPWHSAIPISVLGIVAYQQGNLNEAYQQLTRSLEFWRTVGDPRGLVFCMLYLGMTALALNDHQTTRSILEESNGIAEANMDRWAHAFGLDMLGLLYLEQGKNAEALARFEQSISIFREIGDQMRGAQSAVHMGQAHAALGSTGQAKRLFLEAYSGARQAGWTIILLNVLVAYTEMQNELQPETKLEVAHSVLSHPAITPNIRKRCESLRDGVLSTLTAGQIDLARDRAGTRDPETLAGEIIR